MQRGPFGLVLGQSEHGRDRLAFGQWQQVDHRAAARGGTAFGQLPHLHAVHLAQRREEQHRRVRAGHEQVRDRVFILGGHARTALAAARLGAEGVERGALDIALHRHGDDHVLALDQILIVNAIGGGGDVGLARGREFGADRDQFLAHHREQLGAIGENGEQFGDRIGEALQFVADLVATECGEAVEAQIEDRTDLQFGQAIGVAGHFDFDRFDQLDERRDLGDWPVARQQRFARCGGAGRAADHADDLVEVGHRDDETQQQMRPVARLGELELGTAGDDFLAEGHERGDDIAQVEQFRAAATDRQHVGGEARLRGRVPPQLVEHDLRGGIALEIDDDAHAKAARFVANVADAFDALVLGGFCDLLDQAVLAGLIRDFGEHDRAAIAAPFLDDIARAHDDRAASGFIRRARACAAEDDRARWKIGTGDDLDQFLGGQRFARAGHRIDDGERRVDHFAEIVRRDVGRHADGDAARAIDQQIGETRRQHRRLALGPVIVGHEIDGVLVDVLEQRTRDLGETRLGIAHGRGLIGVHRAEIALAVDQRHAHRPVLAHTDQGFVDRAVTVRVIFTHRVTDDAGAFAIGPVINEAAFRRRPQDTAVDGLQTITNIGKRARDDHAHRIVEIARLHLVDDRDRGNVGRVGEDGLVGQFMVPSAVLRECDKP
ncbi:hypothetical protein D9M73_114790 [compost metagenome]